MEFVNAREVEVGKLIIGSRNIAPDDGADIIGRTEFGLVAQIENPEHLEKYILWLGSEAGKLLAVEPILNQEVFNTGQQPVVMAKPHNLGSVGRLDHVVADPYNNRPIMKGGEVLFYAPRQDRGRLADHHQFMMFGLSGRRVDVDSLINQGAFGVIGDWTVRPAPNAGFELDIED